MPQIEKHNPGTFCWFELGTTDQNAAKSFYSGLFGWSSEDYPMGPNGVYTLFRLNGCDTGGCYKLEQQQLDQGVPPHWMLYVAVDSVDLSASKSAELGGKVIVPPFDVVTFGRMAVLQDPTGAHFCVWEPKSHTGVGITGEPGTICWSDLSTNDQGRAAEFYKALFGWAITGEPNEYLHIEKQGGIPPSAQRDPNIPPHWINYFLVTDCDLSAQKVKDLGGKVLFGPFTMENVGRMAFVADPQGAAFALYQAPH